MTVDSVTLTTLESDQVSTLITRGLRLATELESRTAEYPDIATAEATVNGFSYPFDEVKTFVQPPPDGVAATGQTDWAEVWLQRGHHKFRLGDYRGAGANYDKALQKRPHLVSALNGKGSVLYAQNNFEAARAAFGQALMLQPDCAYIHCNLGSTLYWLNDLAGAVSAYEAAIALEDYPVNAYYGLGVTRHRQGQYREAMIAYEQATQINPRHADSYYGLGCLRYSIGDRRGAVAAYRKAMQCNPYYTDIYLKVQLQNCC
jgi:tetratricopeptide (TPR) repeat protein